MKLIQLTKEPWPRIIGIPLVSLVTTFIYNEGIFSWEKFLVSMIFVGVMWNGDYFLITLLRKKFPLLDQTNKRVLCSVLAICLFNTFADFITCTVLYELDLQTDRWLDSPIEKTLKNLMITAVVATIYEAGYFFAKWKKQTIEMEQLKSQQLKSELSALKNQISPHFLFNSLNTLVTLIHENQDQAAKFTEKLSEVYRYILQFKNKELVKLSTEIKFSEAFIYLLKMRFEKGLDIQIDVNEEDLDKYVAPLTTQMLIENAVKHNVVSRNQPLHIHIYAEKGKSLIVKNNLQHKPAEGKSTFTGLENIKSRYSLLTNREVDVIKTHHHFMVALPLVELIIDEEGIFEEVYE
ncbi:MAG: histidine kinase [Bacteroidota bacterium]